MGLFDLFSSVSRMLELDEAGPDVKAETELCLDLALGQRCVMAVAYGRRRLADLDFSGPCLLMREDTLIIDAPTRSEHAACLGEEVTVYFRLEREGELRFYSFASKVRGCGQSRGFALERPAELGSEQRRAFARVVPPPGALLFLQAWALGGEDLPPPHCLKPALPEGEPRQRDRAKISLLNISAGGLRLKLGSGEHELARCCARGSRLACFLRLKDAQDGPDLSLWLACTVTNSLEQEGLHLGVGCAAWASDEERPEPTAWTAAGENGLVPPLGGWIWKQQRNRTARYR